jgi:GAF domain-containing protein
LFDVTSGNPDRVQQRVTQKLRDLTGVLGISLHTTAEYADTLVVRASSGDLPERMLTSSIPIPGVTGETQLKRQFDQWMRALRSGDATANSRSIVLKTRHRVVGILCLSDPSGERLQRAADLLDEIAPSIAQLLADDLEQELLRKRLKEAELLYTVSTITQGAESSLAIAARVVRELWTSFDLDHLAVHFVDMSGTMTAASEGATASLFPHLQLGGEVGLDGWLALQAPEIVMNDATEDDRVDKRVAIQKRVGSYAVFPIRFGEEPFGFLTAATHRVGGIDVAEAETLRILTAELSQAVGRLESQQGISGLVTPGEFQAAMARGLNGSLVYLEPVRRDEIVAEFGEPAYEHAIRNFARRLKTKLPAGGMLCRRREGDYVAFLRDVTEAFASSWSNEASAMAAMIGVSTPDGRAKIPLALRAKVSMITPQGHQISDPEAVGATNP